MLTIGPNVQWPTRKLIQHFSIKLIHSYLTIHTFAPITLNKKSTISNKSLTEANKFIPIIWITNITVLKIPQNYHQKSQILNYIYYYYWFRSLSCLAIFIALMLTSLNIIIPIRTIPQTKLGRRIPQNLCACCITHKQSTLLAKSMNEYLYLFLLNMKHRQCIHQ